HTASSNRTTIALYSLAASGTVAVACLSLPGALHLTSPRTTRTSQCTVLAAGRKQSTHFNSNWSGGRICFLGALITAAGGVIESWCGSGGGPRRERIEKKHIMEVSSGCRGRAPRYAH
ncbi:unnamed protein product, partial [Phaeothamnion confervicola]